MVSDGLKKKFFAKTKDEGASDVLKIILLIWVCIVSDFFSKEERSLWKFIGHSVAEVSLENQYGPIV